MQMQRVQYLTRQFADWLKRTNLNKAAKGTALWTQKALLEQMEAH